MLQVKHIHLFSLLLFFTSSICWSQSEILNSLELQGLQGVIQPEDVIKMSNGDYIMMEKISRDEIIFGDEIIERIIMPEEYLDSLDVYNYSHYLVFRLTADFELVAWTQLTSLGYAEITGTDDRIFISNRNIQENHYILIDGEPILREQVGSAVFMFDTDLNFLDKIVDVPNDIYQIVANDEVLAMNIYMDNDGPDTLVAIQGDTLINFQSTYEDFSGIVTAYSRKASAMAFYDYHAMELDTMWRIGNDRWPTDIMDIKFDHQNNFITLGKCSASYLILNDADTLWHIDPGYGVNVFTAKYDSNHELVFGKRVHRKLEWAGSIFIDQSNSIYIPASFQVASLEVVDKVFYNYADELGDLGTIKTVLFILNPSTGDVIDAYSLEGFIYSLSIKNVDVRGEIMSIVWMGKGSSVEIQENQYELDLNRFIILTNIDRESLEDINHFVYHSADNSYPGYHELLDDNTTLLNIDFEEEHNFLNTTVGNPVPYMSTGYLFKIDFDYSTSVEDRLPSTQLVKLYPNPVAPDGKVHVDLLDNSVLAYDIYTAMGELVLSQRLEKNKGTQTITLDMSTHSSGAYFLILKNTSHYQKQIIIKP